MFTLGRLADSRDYLCNGARNNVYKGTYVAYMYFFKPVSIFVHRLFVKSEYQ